VVLTLNQKKKIFFRTTRKFLKEVTLNKSNRERSIKESHSPRRSLLGGERKKQQPLMRRKKGRTGLPEFIVKREGEVAFLSVEKPVF